MIIPCIDLMGGRVVQLRQGRDLVLERTPEEMIAAFAGFPRIHVIDLDAALDQGENSRIAARIIPHFRVRFGGGIRSPESARSMIEAGADQVIVGSAAFRTPGLVSLLAKNLGPERVVVAIDSLGGQVAVDGWRTTLPITPQDAMAQFEPYCAGFLCTCVDNEGQLRGTDLPLFLRLRESTGRTLIAAGGITTMEEVRTLTDAGLEVALGMAIYSGGLSLEELRMLV